MLRILHDEGFDISERELMRVRAKNRWLLRVPNGTKPKKRDADQDVINQLQAALYPGAQLGDTEQDEAEVEDDANMTTSKVRRSRAESPPLSPEVLAKRQERFNKLQAESEERWAARKRRRRTRGWAGLPADPPGPPRFPSETTIDESKQFLSLDSKLYRDVRAKFQRICEEADIIKKTIAGPEKWEAAKDRLIQESSHLQGVFWGNEDNLEAKKLALDVICSDVTKRMRTLERRMTIAEAKNALGVNPEESRQLRNAFYQVLKADHFTSKLEAGDEHWKELKQIWIDGSEFLQNIVAAGDADPVNAVKIKAMEVLCRDVMKRLRDDQTKRDPARKKKPDANFSVEDIDIPDFDGMSSNDYQQSPTDALIQAATQAQAQVQAQPVIRQPPSQRPSQNHTTLPDQQGQPQNQVMMTQSDMQIDPSLLLAANDSSIMNARNMQQGYYATQYAPDSQFGGSSSRNPISSAASSSIAVYFRLLPESDVQSSARIWVSTLGSVSVDELRQLATVKFPHTIVYRIEGVMKQQNGHEMTLPIDQDDELEAYLAAINGVKPTFAVQLVSAWKA